MMNWLLPRFARDQKGTAVLELGLAIPFIFVLLLGMIDFARGFSIKLQLEQVAQRAIERVMNGQADDTQMSAIKQEASTVAGVPLSNVTTSAWLECSNAAGTSTPTYTTIATTEDVTPCADGQTSRRYLRVTINKNFATLFNLRWAGGNADGTYTITGATSVRIQ